MYFNYSMKNENKMRFAVLPFHEITFKTNVRNIECCGQGKSKVRLTTTKAEVFRKS